MFNILCGNRTSEVFYICKSIEGLYTFSYSICDVFVSLLYFPYYMQYFCDNYTPELSSKSRILKGFSSIQEVFLSHLYFLYYTQYLCGNPTPEEFCVCKSIERLLFIYFSPYVKYSFSIYASSTICIIFGPTMPPKCFEYVRAMRYLFRICGVFLSNLCYLYFMIFFLV